MDDSCAVCAESLDWVAYGSCGHREVCSTCVVRLRFVLQDRKCCICKTELNTVFVTKALGDYTRVITNFSAFTTNASEGQVGSYWYHKGSQAYFDDVDHYHIINAMCKVSCSICDNSFKNQGIEITKRGNKFICVEGTNHVEQLKCHLYHQHKMFLCHLCLEGRKVFISEQKLYTKSQLDQHMSTGDLDVDGSENERGGFKGHPICEFCRDSFYGDNELYRHMSTEHFTCHICQRQHPERHDYFNHYDDLEIHFRQEHCLCEYEVCLGKKFVVFQSEAEMKRHYVREHGGNMSRSKRNAALQIPTSFTYRRINDQDQQRGRGRGFNNQPYDSDDGVHSVSTVPLSLSRSTHILEHSYFSTLSNDDPPNPSNNAQPPVNLTDDLFPPLPRAKKAKNPKNKIHGTESTAIASRLNKMTSVKFLNSAQPSSSKTHEVGASTSSNSASFPQSKPVHNHMVSPSSSASFPRLKPLHNHGVSSSSSASVPQFKPVHNHVANPSSSTSIPQLKPVHNHVMGPASSASFLQLKPVHDHVVPSDSASFLQLKPVHDHVVPSDSASFPHPRPMPNHDVHPTNSTDFPQLTRPIHNHAVVGPSNLQNFPQLTVFKHKHEAGTSDSASLPQLVRPIQNQSLSASNSTSIKLQKKPKSNLAFAASEKQVPPISEEIQIANNTLIERIRNALGDGKKKFAAFKCISTDYLEGQISTKEYIFNVERFGLMHLLLDLAQLCPDPDKKKDLINAYNVDVQESKNNQKKKGKGEGVELDVKLLDSVRKLQLSQKHHEILSRDGYRNSKPSINSSSSNSNGSGEASKKNQKTSKFLRTRLGESSEAAALYFNHANDRPEITSKECIKKPPPEGFTVNGAWRNNDVKKKLFTK